jgi:hypothetical protein
VKNLQDATERICELKGGLLALDALMPAVLTLLPGPLRVQLIDSFDAHAEAARTVLLHADISDTVLQAFERDVARHRAALQTMPAPAEPPAVAPPPGGLVDALLLTGTRVDTFDGGFGLSSASGFFFRRGGRLFLVTNRHVFTDPAHGHHPDRIEIGVHTDAHDMTRHVRVSLPLVDGGLRRWREATDTGGLVDVAALEIPFGALPADAALQAFDASHLDAGDAVVAVGDALTIVGFPMGFHDTVHHLAVARGASVASAYGVRFQRQGCFLTDARTHRGSSGSPVVRRRPGGGSGPLQAWQLLGVHSTRIDMSPRDPLADESLGLNGAWYADVLDALTAEG